MCQYLIYFEETTFRTCMRRSIDAGRRVTGSDDRALHRRPPAPHDVDQGDGQREPMRWSADYGTISARRPPADARAALDRCHELSPPPMAAAWRITEEIVEIRRSQRVTLRAKISGLFRKEASLVMTVETVEEEWFHRRERRGVRSPQS